jgi:hypothetical protein
MERKEPPRTDTSRLQLYRVGRREDSERDRKGMSRREEEDPRKDPKEKSRYQNSDTPR